MAAYHTKLEELTRLGIQLDVVIPHTWGGQRPEEIEGKGYVIHRLPVVFSGKNHFHYYPALNNLIAALRPDVIHIDEESFSVVTYLVMRRAKSLGIPAVFFNWQNIYKIFPWPFSAMERYTMASASACLAGSSEVKEVLLKKGCRIPIYVIPQFGVDTKIFYRNPQPELKKKIADGQNIFIAGYIGRLVEEKGIYDVLNAVCELPETVHLAIIGSGPERSKLEQNAILLGISNRIHYMDQVDSNSIPRYMNALDCLILPSRTRPHWKEQFGRVLIEAMACEVPVIGSSSGEIPQVIGDAGLIFPEGDVTALKNALLKIFTDKNLQKEIGRQGRERVEQMFTQKIIAEETYKVYKSILQK